MDGAQGGGAQADPKAKPSPFTPPQVNLPKGGGAIRGIDEKFAANPVTGAGSLSAPLALSPGRSGFGPRLSARIRFRKRQRRLWHWLEAVAAVDHAAHGQGAATVSRQRRIRHLHPVGRRGSRPGPARARTRGGCVSTNSNATAIASSAIGRALKACSRESSAGPASRAARRIGARCRKTTF